MRCVALRCVSYRSFYSFYRLWWRFLKQLLMLQFQQQMKSMRPMEWYYSMSYYYGSWSLSKVEAISISIIVGRGIFKCQKHNLFLFPWRNFQTSQVWVIVIVSRSSRLIDSTAFIARARLNLCWKKYSTVLVCSVLIQCAICESYRN